MANNHTEKQKVQELTDKLERTKEQEKSKNSHREM